jgi:hypothetical protein
MFVFVSWIVGQRRRQRYISASFSSELDLVFQAASHRLTGRESHLCYLCSLDCRTAMKTIVDLNLVTLASTQVEIIMLSFHFFSFSALEYMVWQLATISIRIA